MLTVYVICEGQTEETFIKEVLFPHFMPKLHLIPITLKGNVKIERILSNVKKLLLRRDAYCTTLFDFYGLPPDFPGMVEATRLKIIHDKARCITRAMHEHSQQAFHENLVRRFLPYVQMYEFEGLLFSDPHRFAVSIERPHLAQDFVNIRNRFPTPEDINDSPETAPSKRILQYMHDYDKPLHGGIAILDLGLAVIRRECRLFNDWLVQLETLA